MRQSFDPSQQRPALSLSPANTAVVSYVGPSGAAGANHNGAFGAASSAARAAIQILPGTEDKDNGILVDPEGLPSEPDAFTQRLAFSLQVSLKQVLWFILSGCVHTVLDSAFLHHGNAFEGSKPGVYGINPQNNFLQH